MAARNGFTLVETLIIVLIIGIIAAITIPKFIDLRMDANNARYEGCRGGMRSAVSMYYSRTGLPEYENLCTTANPYRTTNTDAPCYPASCDEVMNIIISMGCDVNCEDVL